MMGFQTPLRAVIVGANRGIGAAFVEAIQSDHAEHQVWATARNAHTLDGKAHYRSSVDITQEETIQSWVTEMKQADFTPNLVINCTGLLHHNDLGPEKTWRHLEMDTMREVFEVNTFGVALLGKHLLPMIPRQSRGVFATLSARVGSISDNRLGGWYSYRASKAAQNMMIKTLALEARRKWESLVCVALHPGTVDSALSAPFSSRVPPHKLFTASQSCGYLIQVIDRLRPHQTGGFFAWDGQAIEY